MTTAVISIALQVAATKGFRCALGDLKNAFMQSDPLHRQEGRLFCKQPSGGLPGLEQNQLIEILAGAYGLGAGEESVDRARLYSIQYGPMSLQAGGGREVRRPGHSGGG